MEYSQTEKLILIDEKVKLKNKLDSLYYGAIEVRNSNNKQYLYVHYRHEGRQMTKYVGENSEELRQMILQNNNESKQIKKQLKRVLKELKAQNYVEPTLDSKVELNIDFARRSMADSIYKQSVLEGIATTYADTETIIEGGNVSNMSSEDVHKILNMKHAWQFILNRDVISSPSNYALLSEINKLVIEGFYYNAGKVRGVPVSIGGTSWTPNIPIESDVKDDIKNLEASEIPIVEKAVEFILYIMKKQIFIDGNKRTAVLFANHLLISHAQGLIIVPSEKVSEFKDLLIKYYEGTDIKTIKEFLINYCFYKLG